MTENQAADHQEKTLGNDCKELLLSLPRERGWRSPYIYQYQGFWCPPGQVEAIISFQNHFQARESDIILVSSPKSGTTWLKALVFAIVNRHRFEIKTHPLLTSNPHSLVPFFEYDLYENNRIPDFSSEPRIIATHIHFQSLGTIKESNCKIVYICRNPLDSFVSAWHYFNKVRAPSLPPLSIDEAFDMYCNGTSHYGPFWDHILGYWEESLKRPNNVLFLKYEDMKNDVVFHLKTLAAFVNYPFSEEEEKNGVIEDVAKLCSFETLAKLDVNTTGLMHGNSIQNKNFFRKGGVGDWVNYLTSEMEERMSKLVAKKFGDSSLTFKVLPELAVPVKQN